MTTEVKTEYELKDKLLGIRRTAQTTKGGRDLSFQATVTVGDGKSKVGIGVGKAKEVPAAIKKATEAAKKSMIHVSLDKGTIRHALTGKHGATKVVMLPASDGTGVIAGGAMRAIFECLGIENILAKRYGSSNALNVAQATLNGLKKMMTANQVSKRRGKKVEVWVEEK